MDVFLIVLLGLAGAALGFGIPDISQSLSLYKCRKKNLTLSPESRFTSAYVKLGLCLLNGALLFSTAVLIAIIDIRIRIVPNELLLVMLILGIAFQATQFGLTAILVAALCMIGMMVFFTFVAGMVGFDKVGAGDVKLAGAMGLALGYPNIISALIIMCAGFLLFSVIGLLIRKLTLKSMLPFAPFMMTGMVVALASIAFQLRLE